MANFFPPKPIYPKNYDSDKTLFLVFNTSETITTDNNQPWSDEISIKPVDDTKPEIWADNGFATINGELFYYDDVEKNTAPNFDLVIGKIKLDEEGGISYIPIISNSNQYFYYPAVKVKGSGFGAKVEAIVNNGVIIEFKVIQPGKGYKTSTTSLVFEGKVTKLKRCSRNIGGTHTKFNSAGSEVRGFVIAEHHNQLADAIIKAETFIGRNFDEDKDTLDWRIRNLQNLPIIFDDYTCADVSFTFYIVSEDAATGTTIQYDVVITGGFNSYTLDFGDGQSTNTSFSGTHLYAANSTIDPIVTVVSDSCTVVQTPILRNLTTEPVAPPTVPGFSINIPIIPDFPPFTFPSIPIPSTPQIPPIVFPCLDIGPIGPINVPSVISIIPPIEIPSFIEVIPSINIPSIISFIPSIDFPSLISVIVPPDIPSWISFTDPPTIPSWISFTDPPTIPSWISFADPPTIPSWISFADPPSCIPQWISFADPPLTDWWVSWVDPTEFSWWEHSWWVSWTNPEEFSWWEHYWWVSWADPSNETWWEHSWYVSWVDPSNETWWEHSWWVSWVDAPTLYSSWWEKSWYVSWTAPEDHTFWVSWSTPPTVSCVVTVQCPTSSSSMFRNRLDNIDQEGFYPNNELVELSIGDVGIPSEIKLVVPEIPDIKVIHDIPAIIRVSSPNIPSEIKITMDDFLPSEIKVVAENIPTLIELSSKNIPSSIEVDFKNLPKSIPIEVPEQFPSIKLDASGLPDKIQVVGIPSTIELVGAPSEIKLVLPEKPEIELVYKGAPIDVKINLDVGRLTGDNDKSQCVAIVPCN